MAQMTQKGLIAGLIMMLVSCSGGGGGGGGAVVPFTEDPAVYTKEPDASTLISVTTGSGTLTVPVTLILFVFDETVDTDAAGSIIGNLGGNLTGQMPALGIYQGEFSSLTTLAELDAKLTEIEAQAIAGLVAVSYDAMADGFDDPEPLDNGEPDTDLDLDETPTLENCHVTDDNMWLGPRGRCPLENAEYFQLIAIMDYLKGDIPFSTVKVGVMDTGIQQNYGEFDDITLINVDAPGTSATDTDSGIHGTKVASIIAADDDGMGMNGIASKVLGNKLVIGSTSFKNKTVSQELVTLAQMAGNGFSMVNMSFGYVRAKYTAARYAALRTAYKQGLARLSQVLFVTAASNDPFELTRENDCPAGIDLPNVMTVGGMSNCEIDEPYDDSSYGPLIDIAAPAVRVICVSTLGRSKIAGSVGNSFATPQVTAIAAILKSIDPSLTPAQLKAYIQNNCLATAAHVGLRRLVYTLPVLQLLVDRSATSEDVLDLIDRDEDDVSDPAGIIVNRICGGIEYRVSSAWGASYNGTYRVEGDEDEHAGALMSAGLLTTWMFGSMTEEEPPILSIACTGCDFQIYGHSYAVDASGHNVTLSLQPDDVHAVVSGISGVLYMDNCQVLQRNALGDFGIEIPGLEGFDNEPSIIAVEGRFQVTGETLYDGESDVRQVSITGTFVSPLALPLGNASPELLEYIETNCLCGTGVSK